MFAALALAALLSTAVFASPDADGDSDDVMLLQGKVAHLMQLAKGWHQHRDAAKTELFGNDETRPFRLLGHGFFCSGFPLFGKPRGFTAAECHAACANRTDCQSFVTYEHSDNPVACYAMPHNCPSAMQIHSNRSGVLSAYRRVSKNHQKLAAKIFADVMQGLKAQKHDEKATDAATLRLEAETRGEVSLLEQRMADLKAMVEKLQKEVDASNSTTETAGQLSMQDVTALVAEVKELKKENAELKSAKSSAGYLARTSAGYLHQVQDLKKENAELKSAKSSWIESKDTPQDTSGCFMAALQARQDWSTMRACFEV